MSARPTFDESRAHELDARDPLRAFRERFCVPRDKQGRELCYLTGNSLGLMPRRARELVVEELEDWERLAVEAHFEARRPWFSYHEIFRESGERLVGAAPGGGEVVMMNSLTVNLHLLMASFYRPSHSRHRIIIEGGAFPSDEYAVQSQARFHGYDDNAILRIVPSEGSGRRTLDNEDIIDFIRREGPSADLVLLSGVNYVTGQLFDIEAITRAAHRAGCIAGFDLAHAAGNVPLRLHDWGVDFAVWCSYKYLNAGPGALAGAFVHQRHFDGNADDSRGPASHRLEGWWGNDAQTRFQMRPTFSPARGADAWSISNPPILSAAPLRASLDLFDEAGMPALREKSLALHAYTRELLSDVPAAKLVTPADDASHGCQLSITVNTDAKVLQKSLAEAGVVTDFRTPDIIRAAPVPLYNTFTDVHRFVSTLAQRLA